MITPNGGVFGRNPKFNNVTVDGNLTVNGDIALGDDITITDTLTVNGAATFNGGVTALPNAATPTTNVAVGLLAGSVFNAASASSVAIGNNSLQTVLASNSNTAVGASALRFATAGAATISNTTPGTGGLSGGSGTVSGVTLEKDSGTGIMSVYPTVTLTIVSGAVTAVTVTAAGSGATVQSGIVFKATAAGIALGAPSDWKGTLSAVSGQNTAVGSSALQNTTSGRENSAFGFQSQLSNTSGNANTSMGYYALRSNLTGSGNHAIGWAVLQSNTTGNFNVGIGGALGQGSALGANGAGASNVGVGVLSLAANTNGSNNSALGWFSLGGNTTGGLNVAIGSNAGRVQSNGTTALTDAEGSVYVGADCRGNDNNDSNTVVIAGRTSTARGVADGANTTVIGNAETTSTRVAGTATSVLRVDGDTVRIVNDKTPATAGAAGNEGDICWDANYIYVCVAANTWKRAAIATWP